MENSTGSEVKPNDIFEAANQLKQSLSMEEHKTTATTDNQNIEGIWLQDHASEISFSVLGFSLLVLAIAAYLIKTGTPVESVTRLFATILIITLSVFLVVVGYESEQLAPVIGLLGTLAGYLLGQKSSNQQ